MSTRSLDPEEGRIHGIAVVSPPTVVDRECLRLHPDATLVTPASAAKDGETARLAAGAR